MDFFRKLDLYKIIILLSILLIPAALGFAYWVNGQLEVARNAERIATQRNGEIERIGALQRQLESVEKNASSSQRTGGSHRVYFEQQIDTSSGGTLKSTDFEISPEQRVGVSGQKAQDQEVSITFRREGKELDLPRDFIHAMTFNVESSGAQIWKLRKLFMRNVELKSSSGRSKEAPPKTVADNWQVQRLTFARREPAAR